MVLGAGTPYSCGHTGGICSGGGTEVAVDFRFGHALASQPTYANYVAMCGDQRWDDPSPGYIDAINAFTDETGTGGLAGSTCEAQRNALLHCGRGSSVLCPQITSTTCAAATASLQRKVSRVRTAPLVSTRR